MSTTTDQPTEPTEPTTEPTTEPPAEPTTEAEQVEGAEEEVTTGGRRAGNPEAARYRTQLRAAEAERETYRGRVESLLRREAERQAGAVLAEGADLFAVGGARLEDLLDDAGDVDPVKVKAAASGVAETRPGLALRWPDMGQGQRGSNSTGGASWGALLRPGGR